MNTDRTFTLWKRRGWFRLWLVAAVCWASGVALWTFTTDPPWEASTDIVVSKYLFGDVAAARAKKSAVERYKSVCTDGSVVAHVREDRGPPASALESEQAADQWLRLGERGEYWERLEAKRLGVIIANKIDLVSFIARRRQIRNDYHTHYFTVKCVTISRVRDRYFNMLAIIVLPIFGTLFTGAALFFLFPFIVKFFKWLSDGFKEDSDITGPDTALQSDIQRADVSPAASAETPQKSRFKQI